MFNLNESYLLECARCKKNLNSSTGGTYYSYSLTKHSNPLGNNGFYAECESNNKKDWLPIP